MRGEQILIDARLVIEAIEIGGRDQLDQIPVASLVFAQQQQVVVAIRFTTRLVALLRDINLTTDDGFDASFGRLGVELDRAEQVAVIGNAERRHLLFFGQVHEAADFTSAVKKGIVGVAVEVNKRRGHRGILSI